MAANATAAVTRTRLVVARRELPADIETPISVYLKLRGLGPSFLLESVEGGEHLARYSMIGTQPRAILRGYRDHTVLEEAGRWHEYGAADGDALTVLERYLAQFEPCLPPDIAGLPRFSGGAAGYVGYDWVRAIEDIPDENPDPLGLPEAVFLICDRVVLYDHLQHRLLVLAYVDGGAADAEQEAESAIDEIVARLQRPLKTRATGAASAADDAPAKEYVSNFSRADYEAAVARAKEYIAAGDIFQMVLSRRKSRRTTAAPFDIYRTLRRINPSPYMFYLELPDGLRLIGSSPEVLVRLDKGVVETRPLAGTRPRGADAAEDRELERELLADPKERAEHVMLVDLARNDVGRVAQFGTVSVPTVMETERYSHVMHIVSHVRGELRPGRTAFDVLRACFPAGTVSGAPKVRAMEIIEELEPERRGPYAGAVGYFDFAGNMDTCITLRTIVMQGDRIHLQAGAGIVADSDPAREFEESENKLRALSQAVDMAERGMI